MARTILLIDGDQYLHRGCAAVERDVKWDEENHVLASNEVEAWDVVSGSLAKLLKHFGEGEQNYILAISDTDKQDFRKDLIDPTYKSHRIGTRKPLCFYDLKAKMLAELPCRSMPGLEADDVMGILATKPGPDTKIIVSRDKDMRTIPARVYADGTFYNITEAEADYFHLYQTLIGDASDGYKGCPGIGPKKAEKVLLGRGAPAWAHVVEAFAKAGLDEAHALRQARLARILRWSDWDSEKKEVRLWTP
jgi:DNA polymerase-1